MKWKINQCILNFENYPIKRDKKNLAKDFLNRDSCSIQLKISKSYTVQYSWFILTYKVKKNDNNNNKYETENKIFDFNLLKIVRPHLD